MDITKELVIDFGNIQKGNIPPIRFMQKKPTPKRGSSQITWDAVLPGQNRDPENTLEVSVKPTVAYHNDHSDRSDSFGFIVEITDSGEPVYTFGYTGDTKWHPKIIKQYESCDALLVHLGSLIDMPDKRFQDYKKAKDCYALVKDKNHPYLSGLLHFLDDLAGTSESDNKPLVLIGEFGEELRGGIRQDLWKRLLLAFDKELEIIPVDVGLDVMLCEWNRRNSDTTAEREKADTGSDIKIEKLNQVWCVQCEDHVDIDSVDFERYGHDEALFCVCRTCRRSAPHNVLQEKLRELYEVGVPLIPGYAHYPRRLDEERC